MARLGEIKARELFRCLLKLGFDVAHGRGSHRLMKHADGRILLFAFHDKETIGPRMLKKILKDATITENRFRSVR